MQSGFKGTYDVRGWGHTYALSFMLDAAPPRSRAERQGRRWST